MAGVMMEGDKGMEVKMQQVPPIGGADYRAKKGLPVTVPVVESAHLTDAQQQDGVHYDSNISVGEKLTNEAYPPETKMADTSPSDPVN